MKICKSRPSHFITRLISTMLLALLCLALAGCDSEGKDESALLYESQFIVVEGIKKGGSLHDVMDKISIEELRQLPAYKLSVSMENDGLLEAFDVEGPSLKSAINYLGGNLKEYAGVGAMGKDGSYVFLTRDEVGDGKGLLLAHTKDGESKLAHSDAPAFLIGIGGDIQCQLAMVEKIILYEYVPERTIKSLWVFSGLAEGIEPIPYDYKGSGDASIDLGMLFTQLIGADEAGDEHLAFTIKSPSQENKEQAIKLAGAEYFIKVEGEDAPTNLSPFMKPDTNVKSISWLITDRHALMFPETLMASMSKKNIGDGVTGIPLSEIVKEAGLSSNPGDTFDILGSKGEKINVEKEALSKGALVANGAGSAGIVWKEAAGYPNVEKLLCIKVISPSGIKGPPGSIGSGREDSGEGAGLPGTNSPNADTVLSIIGEEITNKRYFSLSDLTIFEADSAKGGVYLHQTFSVADNYPSKRFMVAKGVDLELLMKTVGIDYEGKIFRIETNEGYFFEITKEQLFEKRFYYPGLTKNRSSGAVRVKPMIAWACKGDTQNVSDAEECKLRLIIGQTGLSDPNGVASVQNIKTIKILNKVPEVWQEPQVNLKDGKLVITHDLIDQVKLYYTLDGSKPNHNSLVYNPSASYFQPDLNTPIAVSGNGRLKVKAVGYGKEDSHVVEFEF